MATDMVRIKINDQDVEVEKGRMLLDITNELGIKIPTLCYHKVLGGYSACRLCTVEIIRRGRSKFTAACSYPVLDEIEVKTHSEQVVAIRKVLMELILARCPGSKELQEFAKELDLEQTRFRYTSDENEKCILCGLCVRVCNDVMGRGGIGFANRGANRKVSTPFGTTNEQCLACGACMSICPTGAINLANITDKEPLPIRSEFNMDLGRRRAIYLPFFQAVPRVTVISAEHCNKLNVGNCGICSNFCPTGAINYDDHDRIMAVKVGAIIVATGYDLWDPTPAIEYGYKRYPNVFTIMEFERMINASGPTKGKLLRRSDTMRPKRLGFILCVGSRDQEHGQPYCCSVGCMVSINSALLAKELDREIESTIFCRDFRVVGKGFSKFTDCANKDATVSFIHSEVSVKERPENQNLIVTYDEGGRPIEKEFDLVVLANCLKPQGDSTKLAEILGIECDDFGFFKSKDRIFKPIHTKRDGIYIAGFCMEPMAIPEATTQASAAAASVSERINGGD